MVRSNLAGRSSLVKFTRHNVFYVRARRDHVGASSSDVTKKRQKKTPRKGCKPSNVSSPWQFTPACAKQTMLNHYRLLFINKLTVKNKKHINSK